MSDSDIGEASNGDSAETKSEMIKRFIKHIDSFDRIDEAIEALSNPDYIPFGSLFGQNECKPSHVLAIYAMDVNS